jgi:hypothetical protein
LPAIRQADYLTRFARGQQRPAQRSTGLQIFQRNAGAWTRHAIDTVIPLDSRQAIADRHVSDVALAGIGRQHAHLRHWLNCGYESLIDGKRPHGRGHIAASPAPIDERLFDVDLGEIEGHVADTIRASPNDRGFTQRRNAAAQSVNLPAIRVGTAQSGENNPLTRGLIIRRHDIFGKEHRPTRTASHEDGRNFSLHMDSSEATQHRYKIKVIK